MKHNVSLKFIRKTDQATLQLDLYSHYTCIYGKDSGEGKTEFVSMLEAGMNDDSIIVEAPLPFAIATPGSIRALLGNPNQQILLMDESVVLRDDWIRAVHASDHLLIGITRAMPLGYAYPPKGIYHLSRTDPDWFEVHEDINFLRNMAHGQHERRENLNAMVPHTPD